MVDECLRWTVAEEVSGKETEVLLEAIPNYGSCYMVLQRCSFGTEKMQCEIMRTSVATRWNIDLIITPKDKKVWNGIKKFFVRNSIAFNLSLQLNS